jgi:predicted transposase YbfD/YdcC
MGKRSGKIEEIKGLMRGLPDDTLKDVGIEPLQDLREQFETLQDTRFQPFVEHLLSDIVMVTLIVVMAEADEWIAIGMFAKAKVDWLRTFLPLPNGIPSHDTIQRVMSRIEMLADTAWMLRLKAEAGVDEGEAGPRVIACDGKTSRGSKRNKTDRDAVKAIHTVNAYATDYGLSLAEAVVNEKTNEIPTTRDMLAIVNVEGCVVTWDALNTQKETVKQVIEKRGAYVGALKANQHNFYEDVALYFDEATCGELAKSEKTYLRTVDKKQSGVAVREYYLSDAIQWLWQRKEWAGLAAIGCARRTLNKLSGETIVSLSIVLCK